MEKVIVKKRMWFRIILSPFVYLATLALLIAGLIFPISALILLSFCQLVWIPFMWALHYSGVEGMKPDPSDAFFSVSEKSAAFNHFLGVVIHLWLPVYCTIEYIKYAKFES